MEIIDLLSKNDLLLAVDLIRNADNHYFNLFSNSKDEINDKLLDMHSDERTDFSQVKGIYVEKKIVGAIVFYPASEHYLRQSFSLSYLKMGSKFSERTLKRFNDGVSDFKSNGLYLSRIAISSDYQGQGYCKKTISLLSSLAILNSYNEVLLHVRDDNYPAIRCYTDVGFEPNVCSSLKVYKTFRKKLIQN